ncbi:MAG TPA: sigma-70 family RNA polymerase sigma factor [Candidatus Kapabacteria bacterium]|nr:sigma-70 family RNA polymerase sigma factor [Candidatus Kapabacteria bacterium]
MVVSLDKTVVDSTDDSELLPTRASLLSRIRDWQHESWQEFFETYWKLIYNTARRYGLSDAEAQEVVQETMIGVSRKIPSFEYRPEKCSFKTWLMNLIMWRITDQLRRRRTDQSLEGAALNIPDEGEFTRNWDEEWERNLIGAALERVKKDTSPQTFQVFAFCVLQKKGVEETARVLGVSKARVYLAKHRVSNRISREIERMKEKKDYSK